MSKKEKKSNRRDKSHAAGEIDDIRSNLHEAYAHFNNATDPDALDAWIYEINALRSRYNTALKHYRQRYR